MYYGENVEELLFEITDDATSFENNSRPEIEVFRWKIAPGLVIGDGTGYRTSPSRSVAYYCNVFGSRTHVSNPQSPKVLGVQSIGQAVPRLGHLDDLAPSRLFFLEPLAHPRMKMNVWTLHLFFSSRRRAPA